MYAKPPKKLLIMNILDILRIWIFSANTLTKTTDSVRMISSKF